jgi:predicted DNA-binding transcriptional regulator AlpA
MDMDKVVRRKQLLELIGVSSVTQWRLEKAGLFPQRFRLGIGAVGWHLTEVEEWLRNRERVERQMVERKTQRRAADRAAHGDVPVLVSGRDATTKVEGGSTPGGRGKGTGEPRGDAPFPLAGSPEHMPINTDPLDAGT